MIFHNESYKAMVVGIPRRSWKWGHRAELRIRLRDDDRPMKGRGYWDGLVLCEEVDARYYGPRSRLGKLLAGFGLP